MIFDSNDDLTRNSIRNSWTICEIWAKTKRSIWTSKLIARSPFRKRRRKNANLDRVRLLRTPAAIRDEHVSRRWTVQAECKWWRWQLPAQRNWPTLKRPPFRTPDPGWPWSIRSKPARPPRSAQPAIRDQLPMEAEAWLGIVTNRWPPPASVRPASFHRPHRSTVKRSRDRTVRPLRCKTRAALRDRSNERWRRIWTSTNESIRCWTLALRSNRTNGCWTKIWTTSRSVSTTPTWSTKWANLFFFFFVLHALFQVCQVLHVLPQLNAFLFFILRFALPSFIWWRTMCFVRTWSVQSAFGVQSSSVI